MIEDNKNDELDLLYDERELLNDITEIHPSKEYSDYQLTQLDPGNIETFYDRLKEWEMKNRKLLTSLYLETVAKRKIESTQKLYLSSILRAFTTKEYNQIKLAKSIDELTQPAIYSK